jgi:hypothetical protein
MGGEGLYATVRHGLGFLWQRGCYGMITLQAPAPGNVLGNTVANPQ